MARAVILRPVLCQALAAVCLEQFSLQLARVASSYKVLDIELTAVHVGIVSSLYALIPAVMAVPLGRHYDRHGTRGAMLFGIFAVPAALLALLFEPSSFWTLACGTMLLGISQLVVQSALQIRTIEAGGRSHRDRLVGYFMTLVGIGNMMGPLAIVAVAGLSADLGNGLLLACLAAALPMLGFLLSLSRHRHRRAGARSERVPFASLARTPKLLPLVVISGIYVATQDLILVFMPVLGTERAIPAGMVGLLLSAQALASIAARMCYGMLSKRFGAPSVLFSATLATGLCLVGIALPLPLAATAVCLALAGFALPMALTCSMALVVHTAPSQARATALSLRYTSNRIFQFTMPLAAGLIAFSLGASGIFWALCGLLLAVSLICWRLLLSRRG